MKTKLKARLVLLPTLGLGSVALLLAPARSSEAFTLLGSNLKPNERDVRVFDNFSDATANDNTSPAAQFPGQSGAELAVWKAIVEWGSEAHSDGSGDSTQASLGSGGANFDAFWDGAATSVGNADSNVVSKINTCSSGVLAYCEAPISTGWRIRFCDSWVWNDGPGSIPSGQFDLQGVATHEYGHALGLGHSSVSGATMFPSVGSGVTATRSIEADDIAGVRAIYGARAAGKPHIIATVASAGTLTIHGTGFSATGNQVWFRPSAATSPSIAEPRVLVTGLASNGLIITLPIPANAGPGDVIVKASFAGHSSVSNAFPTDLVGTFGTPPLVVQPVLNDVSPSAIPALEPGTAPTVQLLGGAFDRVRALELDGRTIEAGRWALVDTETIALDLPQAALGQHELAVSDGLNRSAVSIQIVAPATPRLELGAGDALTPIDRDLGLRVRLAGQPGSRHLLLFSLRGDRSVNRFVQLDIGGDFASLIGAGTYAIPAEGWLELDLTNLPPASGPGVAWYAQSIELGRSFPLASSNLQSILLLP